MNNLFSKQHTKVVDQSDVLLPPTWQSRQAGKMITKMKLSDVFISGNERDLAEKCINLLNEANKMVVICTFLLADAEIEDAIFNAAKRGVRVYLMLACETRLDKDPGDDEFSKMCLDQHVSMLKRLGGKVLIRSAPHYHAKMVLADPFGDNPTGFMLTANLTKEAIERNEEFGVVLSKSEIKEMSEIIKWGIWESAEHEMLDGDNFQSVKPLKQIVYPDIGSKVFATTSRETSLQVKAINLIETAQKQILISSFGWDADHPVVKALGDQASSGIDVTVLARIRPAAMPALIKLAKSGVRVVGFKWLHAKAIWTDQNEALVMSANIQKDGLDQGFELGVHLTDGRVNEVRDYLNQWIDVSRWRLVLEPRLGDVMGSVKVWDQNKLEEITVQAEMLKDLGTILGESVLNLDKTPELPGLSWREDPAHKLSYHWIVNAPVLEKNSKEQYQKVKGNDKAKNSYSPPVYKEPNGRRVIVVDSADQIPVAAELNKNLGGAVIVRR
jgi:cardiolipin synthase A/B